MRAGLDEHNLSYYHDLSAIRGLSNRPATAYGASISNQQISAFITKLVGYGLYEHEVTILVDRFVYSKTFKEITEDHGFVDARITHSIYKKALGKAEKAFVYLKEGKN